MSAPTSELLRRIEAAKAAVLAETGLLHREFGRAESRWKSDGTRVTAIDIAISENIFRGLRAQFPEDQMFSEELPEGAGPIALTSRFSWVLDPIDGTKGFLRGGPPSISKESFKEGEARPSSQGGPSFWRSGISTGSILATKNSCAMWWPRRASIAASRRF